MERIPSFIVLLFFILITPYFATAQKNFDWEGRWEVIASKKSFCNIHIVTKLFEGQTKPTAILEGLNNGKPFRITCNIKEIPKRNSIVFHEAVTANQQSSYLTDEPLIILALKKVDNQIVVTPVWMQLDITKKERSKLCKVRKIQAPRYKGTYTFYQDVDKTTLTINKIKKTGFHAQLDKNGTTGIDCECKLQAKHLAVCYPNDEKGAFYLDFNEYGVKLIKNYDDNIYNKTSIKGKGYLVLNTTFKK